MCYFACLTRPQIFSSAGCRGLWELNTFSARGPTSEVRLGLRRHLSVHTTSASSPSTNLPQTVDLLHTYRGLVALGKIKFDEDQVRVIMQLRRLQKTLEGYAPPALASRYFNTWENILEPDEEDLDPWWTLDPAEQDVEVDIKALVRQKGHAEELSDITTPKGLLLTGPPGSGKSFLIDLWYSGLPTPYKVRRHYNELVLEIYRAVWEETKKRMVYVHTTEQPQASAKPWNKAIRDQWRELVAKGSLPKKWGRHAYMGLAPSASPLSPQQTISFAVAQRLILRHWLLVFDEIQLLDVSSATLLADVLSWYWRMGGIIVGTSNKIPDDLYKNGVQRDRLESFVESMKARCPVISLSSEKDWREVRAGAGKHRTWYLYDEKEAFEQTIARLGSDLGEISSHTLTVFGRPVHVPWASGGVCKFSFSELCDQSLGPADYLTLASRYHTLVITEIPILKIAAKDQARRFISLIDALYESRCRIVCQAESEPSQLFFPDAVASATIGTGVHGTADIDVMMAEAVGGTREIYRPNVSSYDAPNMAEAPSIHVSPLTLETLSIFSGKDEQFAFKRALSRLHEMTSESYAREESWTPLPPTSRKWENSSDPVPLQYPVTPIPKKEEPAQDLNENVYGLEPQFERDPPQPKLSPDERPEAPRLREHHIWGMRPDESQ